MHIGFITSHFPFRDAKSVGGIGTSVKNLGDELVKLGHRVSVFVYGQQSDEQLFESGIQIYKIQNVKCKGFSWYFTRKKIQNTINRVDKINQIDIIESPDWEGITSFIKLKRPIIIRLNGSDTYFCHLDQRPVKFLNKFHERRALVNCKGIISVSKFTALITNEIMGIQNVFSIIPNGVNLSIFKPKEEEQQEQIILYFGGIIRKKGLLELPYIFNEVVKKIPSAKLLLIGYDMTDIKTGKISTQEMMLDMFSEKAIQNVKFIGSIPHQDIVKYINDSKVCVFPSFAEALPVSWIEAMALEKAIVASNIGWAKEVIDDGVNGFLVHPKSHLEYANRIIELLENPNLRNEFGKNARKKALEKFSIEVVAKKSLEFYEMIKKNQGQFDS